MQYCEDQIGNKLTLRDTIRKIVSVVPSQTELLSDLGLDDEVVGITKFCVHPKRWKHTKAIVGGTKNLDHAAIDELSPELIIANKEENTQADIIMLQRRYSVWVSDVSTLDDAYNMIPSIAAMTDKTSNAIEMINRMKTAFASLPLFEPKRALYLIWKKPWMTVGTDTFIHHMMLKSGFENVIKDSRYPTLTDDAIRNLNPDVVLLSSEPFPFKDEHVNEISHLLPNARTMLVNGEMFSWYGSRLLKAANYFKELRRF